jgi:hypothetical protein
MKKKSKGPTKAARKFAEPSPPTSATPKTGATALMPTPSKATGATSALRLKIPPILLEGDAPPAPAASGPGQRYAVGPEAPPQAAASASAELPESYGTEQLFLTARDPHWLFAYWDFSRALLNKYNALSLDGHLVLRVYRGVLAGEPLAQVHLHPESRNWFVPVPVAGAEYLAELGYYDPKRQWVALARSAATFTPPDTSSYDSSVRFGTIPPEIPLAQLLALVKSALIENLPLVEALEQLRAQGHGDLPTAEQVKSQWTPAQEKALAEVVSMDQVRRLWIGSLEITELIRRQLEQRVSSPGAALSGVSSPFGGPAPGRSFWFNVNAELVVYGATEPDATVTLGDRIIKLRPDGTFSFRFALPDGDYSLPAAAYSADGVEGRQAHLQFTRRTDYQGQVGTHPQDQALAPPVIGAIT